MVEGGMGTCWSSIRVPDLKFEELQPNHKGILVSDLHDSHLQVTHTGHFVQLYVMTDNSDCFFP